MNKEFGFFVMICLIFAFVSDVHADIMPIDSHPVERCVLIDNNNYQFQELKAVITGPMVDENNSRYIIKENECLTKGYKFNKLSVYILIPDTTPCPKGKMCTLELRFKEVLVSDEIETFGGYVENSNPLIKETLTYKLVQDANKQFKLVLSKRVSEFNNGKENKVEVYDYTKGMYIDEPIKSHYEEPGFFTLMWCYIKGIFGGKC